MSYTAACPQCQRARADHAYGLQEHLEPNPEQTASLGSLHSFTFLGPIIWTAWKLPHFTYDMLPLMADYGQITMLYCHQPSSPNVGAAETTLGDGDGALNPR